MSWTCAVPCCKNTSDNSHSSFKHDFPKAGPLRVKWLDAIGLKDPKKGNLKICRDHFYEEDYHQGLGANNRLKINSVPSKNLHSKKTRSKIETHDSDESSMSDTTIQELKQKVKMTSVSVRLQKSNLDEPHNLRNNKNKRSTNGTANGSGKKRRLSDTTDTSEFFDPHPESKSERTIKTRRSIKEEKDAETTLELSMKDAKPPRKLPTITEAIVVIMNSNPLKYLGLSQEATDLVEIIASNMSISEVNIIITFRKLKLNEDFTILDDYFRLNEGNAEQIFCYTVNAIANYMKHLVTLPLKYNIFEDIPPSYRTTHCQTGLLFSHFTVEIDKSKDFYTNEVTTYGTKHLLHYFYFITPDGCISYVSPGYGGRLMPDRLVSKCEDVQKILQDESYVITTIPDFDEKINDPEELNDEQRLAFDVMKKIRQFSIISGQQPLHADLIQYSDEIVTIIAALVNLQTNETISNSTTTTTTK